MASALIAEIVGHAHRMDNVDLVAWLFWFCYTCFALIMAYWAMRIFAKLKGKGK
jgi:hypothetical protein